MPASLSFAYPVMYKKTVDLLAANGIVSIVDLTHEHFVVPKGVHVRCVDIVSTIIELVFETNKLNY